MKKQNRERDEVLKPIMAKLKSDSDVIFWYRTASFQVSTFKVGFAGCPDLVAVVDCGREGKIALWFIETKAPSSPIKTWEQLPYEQRNFAIGVLTKPMTYFSIISDPSVYAAEKRKVMAL